MPAPTRFHHVDVFTPRPYSGNSLAVFPDASGITANQMEAITKELRHFESIFLQPTPDDSTYHARVFDLIEELDFAGHPVIGAGCVLHALRGSAVMERWTIQLKARTVTVETERRGPALYTGVLDQGSAEFVATPDSVMRDEIATWFSLSAADLDPDLAPEVVSTGLRYLVLPVRSDALARARIAPADLDLKLARLGAQFAYLLDPRALEGRHWNNDGRVEDVATGSGAGCVVAYLLRHGRVRDGETVTLQQGRFVGRPSEITMRAYGSGTRVRSVEVGGDVALVGEGRLDVLPE